MKITCKQRGCVSYANELPGDGLCPVCQNPLIGYEKKEEKKEEDKKSDDKKDGLPQ